MQAIVAIDTNNGMAKNGKIPWYSKKDLAFFKAQTLNNIIIMGSTTLMSLPNSQPLKNRLNIVVTRYPERYVDDYIEADNILFLNEIQIFDFINNPIFIITEEHKKYLKDNFEMFVIGGNQIYNMLIPYCKVVWITRIKKNFECDLVFTSNLNEFSDTEIIYDDDEISIFRMKK